MVRIQDHSDLIDIFTDPQIWVLLKNQELRVRDFAESCQTTDQIGLFTQI